MIYAQSMKTTDIEKNKKKLVKLYSKFIAATEKYRTIDNFQLINQEFELILDFYKLEY